MNQEPYLYHHGVKGMKWGVRKDKRSSSNQRRKDYNSLKQKAAINKRASNSAKKQAADLKKNGVKSKTFKDLHNDYNDKDFKDIYGYTKKEAVDHEIWRLNNEARWDSDRSKKYNEMASSIKNTPANKKTFMDVKRRNEKVAKGLGITGTILGVAGSVAVKKATGSSKAALATAAASGLFGNLAIAGAFPTSDITVYDTYKKKNKN